MVEVCLVCNTGVLNIFQQPKSINIMLQYVLGCQKRQDPLLCETCYNELKIAFNFKRKFHQSRRLRLKNLRRMRAAAESEHNYVQKPGKLSAPSHIPITGAENQFNILKKVDETTGVKNALPNQIESLGLEHTAKDKRTDDEATSTNKTFEQNEATCSTDLSKAQIEDQDKEDHLKTIEARKDLKNVEHLENNGEKKKVFYILELLGPVENMNLGPLDEGNDKENQNEETVQNLTVHSKEGTGMNLNNKGMDLEYGHDISSKLKKTQCVFCFLTFSKFEELVDHKKNHQEEGHPYRCPSFGCKSRFKYWHSRERHLIVHKKTKLNIYARVPPGRTPWICHYCGRGFALKEIFDSHLKSHNRDTHFECKYCFKSFATKNNLQIHLRIHTKGSPFECHECGRGFISFTRLEIHKRIHSGVKPFRCEVCQAAFISSSGLIKHWRVNSHFRGAIKPPDPDLNNK